MKLKKTQIKTNVNSLLGKKAIVTKEIQPIEYGEVKVDGNFWTASSYDEVLIKENEVVHIVEVRGVKLIVKK